MVILVDVSPGRPRSRPIDLDKVDDRLTDLNIGQRKSQIEHPLQKSDRPGPVYDPFSAIQCRPAKIEHQSERLQMRHVGWSSLPAA